MLFDQKAELPIATVRRAPGSHVEIVANDLVRWFAARWQWFKPRTIPVVVAFVGMIGLLQAMSYLSQPPADATTTVSVSLVHDP